MYVDPDVYKAEVVYKDPALLPWEAVQYAYPFATTRPYVPQRYERMTYSESALSAASAQPEGRVR